MWLFFTSISNLFSHNLFTGQGPHNFLVQWFEAITQIGWSRCHGADPIFFAAILQSFSTAGRTGGSVTQQFIVLFGLRHPVKKVRVK